MLTTSVYDDIKAAPIPMVIAGISGHAPSLTWFPSVATVAIYFAVSGGRGGEVPICIITPSSGRDTRLTASVYRARDEAISGSSVVDSVDQVATPTDVTSAGSATYVSTRSAHSPISQTVRRSQVLRTDPAISDLTIRSVSLSTRTTKNRGEASRSGDRGITGRATDAKGISGGDLISSHGLGGCGDRDQLDTRTLPAPMGEIRRICGSVSVAVSVPEGRYDTTDRSSITSLITRITFRHTPIITVTTTTMVGITPRVGNGRRGVIVPLLTVGCRRMRHWLATRMKASYTTSHLIAIPVPGALISIFISVGKDPVEHVTR